MTFEETLKFLEVTLEFKTGKLLTPSEKEILKAAWENETYSNVADNLYMSVGHIKDLASLLWQRLSDVFGEKITKSNFRRVILSLSLRPAVYEKQIKSNDLDETEESPGNILIVDDVTDNIRILTYFLAKKGYKVRSATNGRMALITIRNEPPDVILLDIRMPEMDGYQVCEALKSNEETSEIPVIFLSALDQTLDKVKAFKVGGVDYITKPFERQEVLARIQTQMTLQRQKQKLKKQIRSHQQTSEILYQSRSLLANLLNSSKDGIVAIEAVRDLISEEIIDFRFLVVNPVFAQIVGQKREDLKHKKNLKNLLNQLTPGLFDSLVNVVEHGEAIEQEFYWQNDEQQSWYSLSAVKFADGCSITIRDITNFKILKFKVKMRSYL